MKVSIIIPVYNVERYLKECLDSAVNQTLEDIEIICVNDGSTDSSLDILKEYEEKYSNLKIINQNNKGLSGARNSGLKVAIGKYVYFLDSDDYIELNSMEVCYKEAKNNALDILTFDAQSFYDKNYKKNDFREDYDRKNLIESKIMSGETFYVYANHKNAYRAPVWLNFYRRDFLQEKNLYFYEGILHEDEIHTSKSFIKANKIKYIPRKFFNRRIRENSIMTSKIDKRRIDGNLVIARETYELYLNIGLESTTKQILLEWIRRYYSNSIMFCDILNLQKLRKDIVKCLRSNYKEIINIDLEIQIESPSLFFNMLRSKV